MTNYEKVKEFMIQFNQKIEKYPSLVDHNTAMLRLNLIYEEYTELEDAVTEKDLTGIADALTDILYVTYGTGLAYGIDLDKCFEEVHRSNMSKLGPDGKPIYREDGKVLKGINYTQPDLKSVLDKQKLD
jgi:predicted HAD superfamily Cof-like phosphohydrolase